MKHLVTTTICALLASSAFAQTKLSLYGGMQEAYSSQADVVDVDGSEYELNVDWEGNSFSMPPYYGARISQELNSDWAIGVDFTHTKAYASADSLNRSGYSTMEFTDGINILTAHATRQFENQSNYTPYLGAGIGVTIPHVELQSPAMQDKTFEYQLAGPAATAFAGVDYSVSDNWSVFSEVKLDYHSIDAEMTDPSTNATGSYETDILTYAVNIGISLSF